MKRIAYLLHRFPERTDTFIKREIRSLRRAGTSVGIVAIWKPKPHQTTPESMAEWPEVEFILPRISFRDAIEAATLAATSPKRVFETVRLAFTTRRPGIAGLVYQMFYLAEAFLSAGRLYRSGIDHIHNHFGDHSGLVTMLAARLLACEYSISFHGPHIFMDPAHAAFKEKVANASFIRCISYFCRSQVIVFSGTSDISKLKIVHCGLDMGAYRFREPGSAVRRIFCAARLAPEKGFEFLLRALSVLSREGHDFQLRLAGDGPHRQILEKLSASLGISDRVTFLGNLGERQVAQELRDADIFVLPSLAEGVPVSLMEAMATGVPVVATNIAGTSELVEDGRNGFLVRPADAEALSRAIAAAAADHDLRKRLASAGRAKVEDEFDIDIETEKLRGHLIAPAPDRESAEGQRPGK